MSHVKQSHILPFAVFSFSENPELCYMLSDIYMSHYFLTVTTKGMEDPFLKSCFCHLREIKKWAHLHGI